MTVYIVFEGDGGGGDCPRVVAVYADQAAARTAAKRLAVQEAMVYGRRAEADAIAWVERWQFSEDDFGRIAVEGYEVIA